MKKIIAALLALASAAAFGATLNPVQLLNPAGSTAGQAIVSTGPSTAPGWANVSLSGLSSIAANTVVGNATASSASPTAVAMPSCSGATNALEWTSGTGFVCNSAINAATLGGATFAAPGNIGTTTRGNAFFVNLGVGVTSTGAPLDVETSGAVGGSSANAALARFYAGSSGTPITAITPTVGISRYEAINNIDTEGGQNAALYVQATGNNTSSVPPIAQVNGVTSNVTQIGTGDSVGFFAYSTNSSTNAGHTAYGIFADAIANTAGTNAFAAELFANNSTGTSQPLSVGSTPPMTGIHITPTGANNSTAALWISKDTGSGGTAQWDSGLYLGPSSAITYGVIDASNAVNSIFIQGSHTYGLVLSNGTYSGNAIQATGWQLASNGMTRTSTTPTSAWNTDSTGSTLTIATGSNTALATGNGIIVAEEAVNHHLAMYMCNAGSCGLVFTNGTTWVASTTTPAAGKVSIAYSGTAYAIYNNEGASETITINMLKMNATN